MSDDEIMRWARAADAGVPLALYTQELEPYTQEDVTAARRLMQNAFGQGRIEMLDGTTRTELVRLDHDAVYIGGCDSTYLYGIMRSQQGEEPTRWFRMERTTGQYETMPIPDTDHLCGVWNNQLVLFRERCAEPFASDKISDYSLAGSYSSRFQNTSYDVVLYDPVTAQSRRLYSLNENSGSFTHAALYGDSLYLDTTLWENPDDTPFNAIRLNLRNGETDRAGIPFGDRPFRLSLRLSVGFFHGCQPLLPKMGHHDAVSFQQRSGRRKPAAELCRRQRVPHQLAGR